jgi:hypothetical protein
VFKGSGRGSELAAQDRNVFRRPGRGSGFVAQEGNSGFRHPGLGVGFGTNGSAVMRAHVIAENVAREHVIKDGYDKVRCHACGALRHISRYCRKRGEDVWKESKSAGNGGRRQRCSPTVNPPERYQAALGQ